MCESMAGASNYVLLPHVAGCTFSLSFCRTFKSVFMLFKDVKVFTDFGHSLLEDRVIHKGAWVTAHLSILLRIQEQKEVKFQDEISRAC